MDPLEPETKNLTINKIDRRKAVDFQVLCCRLECTSAELAELIIDEAMQKGYEHFVLPLAKARHAKQYDSQITEGNRKKIEQLQEKLSHADTSTDTATNDAEAVGSQGDAGVLQE